MISEAIKPLELAGSLVRWHCAVAKFNFGSKIEPLPFIWQSLLRLFQNVIEGSEGKINGQALGVALQLCLGGLDRQAQTQGVS